MSEDAEGWTYGSLAARAYDLDTPPGTSYRGDFEFYLHRLRGVAGRILEPATGTGRVLIPLLEAGLNVDGYDASPAMLALCRRNCEERGLSPTLLKADMARFVAPDTYEAIIIPAGTFAMVEDHADALEALARMRSSLLAGGGLILDLDPPPFAPDTRPAHVQACPDGTVITMETLSREIDPVRQVCVRHLRYDKWQDGAWVSAELQRHALRWYGLEEFRQILIRAGFTNITVSGDYRHGLPPEASSRVWTFEATRD
jgi:SAM-dependent methyltransferase